MSVALDGLTVWGSRVAADAPSCALRFSAARPQAFFAGRSMGAAYFDPARREGSSVATIAPYDTASGKRYRVRYRTPDRRQTDRRGFRTKREAQAFAATVEVAKMRGEYVAPADGRVTVDALVDRWLSGRGDLGASTGERYAGIIRTHVAPRWTDVAIGDVRHSDVQAWSAKLTAGGMAPASFRKTVRVLSLALDLAVADRFLAVNPCGKVKIARPEVAPRR